MLYIVKKVVIYTLPLIENIFFLSRVTSPKCNRFSSLLQLLKTMNGSPAASISGDDDMLSDQEDPIHSESLLQELFYKNNVSDDDISDMSGDEISTKKHKNLEDDSNMVRNHMYQFTFESHLIYSLVQSLVVPLKLCFGLLK